MKAERGKGPSEWWTWLSRGSSRRVSGDGFVANIFCGKAELIMSSYRIDGLDSSSGMSTLTVIPSGSYPLIYTQSNNTLQQTPNDQLVQTTSNVIFESVESKTKVQGEYIATGVTDLGGFDTINGNDITALQFIGALLGNASTATTATHALTADTATTATHALTADTATTATTAITATTAANATLVDVTSTTSIATFYPLFVTGTGSGQTIYNSGTFNFNPNTNTLTITNVVGNASTATLAATATLATRATNISAGAVGNIPYQLATNSTAFLTNGASGSLLTSNGVGFAPSYTSPYSYTASLTCGGASASTNSITLTVVNGTPLNMITRILSSVSTQSFNALSGFSLDTVNNRFTCLTTGSYYVEATFNIVATTTWDIHTDFYLNGSNTNAGTFLLARSRSTSGTPAGLVVRLGFNFNFTAGQYFDFRMILATGTTTMTGNMQNGSSITVRRIPA